MGNGTHLLNHAAVKAYILDRTKQARPFWGCTRVSREELLYLEAHIRSFIERQVESHPTLGKTFRP